MKRIGIVLIMIMTLVSCQDEVTNVVKGDVVIVKETDNEVNNDTIDVQIQDKTQEKINWSFDSTIEENEEGLSIIYNILNEAKEIKHTFVEEPEFDKMWYDMFIENGGEICEFMDYNFDGYLDIKTQQYGAMVNQYYNIRLWDVELQEFTLSEPYSYLPNLEVNVEKEQLFSNYYDRGLGNYELYNHKDGELLLVGEIHAVFNDDGSFFYQETINDNTVDIHKKEELNDIWAGYKVFIE